MPTSPGPAPASYQPSPSARHGVGRRPRLWDLVPVAEAPASGANRWRCPFGTGPDSFTSISPPQSPATNSWISARRLASGRLRDDVLPYFCHANHPRIARPASHQETGRPGSDATSAGRRVGYGARPSWEMLHVASRRLSLQSAWAGRRDFRKPLDGPRWAGQKLPPAGQSRDRKLPRSRRGGRGSASRSSPRCPRWRCAPARSTSARASRRRRAGRGRSRRLERDVPRLNQYAPGIRRARAAARRSRAPAAAYGLDVDPDREVWSPPGPPRRSRRDPGPDRRRRRVVLLEPCYDSYVAIIPLAPGVRRR